MLIAGLHAHHSNIDYLEQVFINQNTELLHFVDPGLIKVIQSNVPVNIKKKVMEQLNWIAISKPDVIIVTCTNYIVYIDEPSILGIPIIKIDEPFFEALKGSNQVHMYFTNPNTVTGTMNRLNLYLQNELPAELRITIINDTFDLIMANQTSKYNQAIVNQILNDCPKGLIAFPQLSMATAAEELRALGFNVITPLDALTAYFNKENMVL